MRDSTAAYLATAPAAVLLASLRLDVGAVDDVHVIRWNGRTGVDDAGYRMSTWIEMEAAKLHRVRTGG